MNTHGYFGEDVEEEREDSQVDPDALTSKAPPQVLRHGEDLHTDPGSLLGWACHNHTATQQSQFVIC